MLNYYRKHCRIFVMDFRKPWLWVKLVNLDFCAKLSNTDYNESNKPIQKSVAHIESEKSFVELVVPKNDLFHIFPSTEEFTFHPEPWVA